MLKNYLSLFAACFFVYSHSPQCHLLQPATSFLQTKLKYEPRKGNVILLRADKMEKIGGSVGRSVQTAGLVIKKE